MDAAEAIRRLPAFVNQLRLNADGVNRSATEVMQQWRNLGRAGGQRCDSAAALLSHMETSLRALEDTARFALEMIEDLKANPFGDK